MERENIIAIVLLVFNLLFWGCIALDYITENTEKNKGKSKEKNNT